MKVKVYFNLHKKLFSVVAMEGPNKGRVIKHVNKVDLERCIFRVQQAGRKRVIKENRKNVHAYVSGHMRPLDSSIEISREATYNPYKHSTFIDRTDSSPVRHKKHCRLVVENNRAKILTSNN